MTTPDSAVSVRDLRKKYGSFTALDGVSFDIHRGETFALLGPNGAGKSTTIEILEGYRDRSGGEASVLGVDPQRGGVAWKARLGIVLQSTGESGNVTVREQLTHFAGYYANPRNVDEVIEAVGLGAKQGTLIRKLSGGQQRRVDVALGIIGRPELLFLDEPTTGFDPEARRSFWDLIRLLKSEGTTILLTTHYLDEAAQLGDRAGVIAGGKLIDIGAIDEIGGLEARIPIVRWVDADGTHEKRTNEPGMVVADLVKRHGSEPTGLEIVRPSLEDIYLGMLGGEVSTSSTSEGGSTTEAGEERGLDKLDHRLDQRHTGDSIMTTTMTTPALAPGRWLRLGLSRTAYEIKTYFRQGDSVFFTFLFPVVFLTIFSVAFSEAEFGSGADALTAAEYYLPGMLAAGLLLSGLQNLAIDIATEKSDGTLKRLAGSPLPVYSYFMGKIGQVLVTGTLQAILLLVVARFVFQVELPTEPERWLVFAWVFLLGVTTSAILGIALSGLPRSGKSATAVIIPITLVLQFISGVYLAFSQLPEWLQNFASIFPLKWMAQGMRSVFLPDSFATLEQGGEWGLGWVALFTLVWLVVGLVACRFTFRWIRKDS